MIDEYQIFDLEQRWRVEYRAGVYLIFCAPTGEAYVGKTRRPFRARWIAHYSHIRCGNHPAEGMRRRVVEYGPSAFYFVVAEALNHRDKAGMHRAEREWIYQFGRKWLLLNGEAS